MAEVSKQPLPEARVRGGVYLDTRVLFAGGAVALIGVVVLAAFMWMVPKAAAREAKAACSGLHLAEPYPVLCPGGGTCSFPLPAPDFTAIDHNGKPVHLSDFRGKVVLLNFWASWCGLCKNEKPQLNAMAADLASNDYVVIALASDRTWSDVLVAIIAALAPHSGLDAVQAVTGTDAGAIAKILEILRTHPDEHDAIMSWLAHTRDKAAVDEILSKSGARKDMPMSEVLAAYRQALPSGVPFQVFLDRPAGDGNIGQIAAAWGITAVPETALIDRQGNIRAYFVSKRDWQSPVAETCLRSVIDE